MTNFHVTLRAWSSPFLRPLSVLIACAYLSGCSIQPWVKPYERESLADPIMSFASDPISAKHFEHVRDVREAARGATGVEGGGCGCN